MDLEARREPDLVQRLRLEARGDMDVEVLERSRARTFAYTQEVVDGLGSGPAGRKVRQHLGHPVQVCPQRYDGRLAVPVAASLRESGSGREAVAHTLAPMVSARSPPLRT
jgi:hypothetical protein